MKHRINIAIDGYSSCGKSTLAKAIAKELNYIYTDTGAMYRAVGLFALQNKLVKGDWRDVDGLIRGLENVYITFRYNPDNQISEVHLNGQSVELEIRSLQVSNHVSQVSDIPEVRQKLVKQQQRIASNRGVVMDGRDIGTVVMPDAEIKFFMTADKQVRAQRRFDELKSKGVTTTIEEVLQNIEMRDDIDSNRAADPLRQAKDAIVIDNTTLTLEEQFEFAMRQIDSALAEIEKKSLEMTDTIEQ